MCMVRNPCRMVSYLERKDEIFPKVRGHTFLPWGDNGCVLCFSENPKHSTKTCENYLLMFFTFVINELEVREINFEDVLVPFLLCNCSYQSANQSSLKIPVGSQ